MNSIELFAGAGGLALGLNNAGFQHRAIVELNKDACRTIKANKVFDYGSNLYQGDVANFNYLNLPNTIDFISGGPPCQPFSVGGKAKGCDDSRDMFPEAIRAIRERKPKAFLFENVKGLLRKSFEDYFNYIILQLQYPTMEKKKHEAWESHRDRLQKYHVQSKHTELEYHVTYHLVNAADYGVPQKRARVFMIGFRADLNINWSFPETTHSEDALLWSQWVTKDYWYDHNIQQPHINDKLLLKITRLKKKYGMLKPKSKRWLTVRDAISDMPEPDVNITNHYNHHIFKAGAKIYPGHTGSYIDEPSKALKAGGHGVPGGENMIRYENGEVRYFTVRESARIQTFPDDYAFEGSWGEVMRQLGNAVPARLATIIGQSVFHALSSYNSEAQY